MRRTDAREARDRLLLKRLDELGGLVGLQRQRARIAPTFDSHTVVGQLDAVIAWMKAQLR